MERTFLRRGTLGLLLVVALSFSSAGFAAAQTPAAATDTGCCGPVTANGQRLIQAIDSMDVEHHWQQDWHVDWETGRSDRFEGLSGSHTHCSAFAAAFGLRLGVYMLRPPEHPQALLASAQGRWFGGEHARREGWPPVASPHDAQVLANQGQLVVLVYVNPDAHVPGHIALVRPAVKSEADLAKDGPQTAQAGRHNFSSGTARFSFASHEDAWPTRVAIYAHAVDYGGSAPAAK